MLLPKEIVENYIENSQNKIKTPTKTMILLGLMAGMFIACGASASNVAMHSIDNIALSRFIGGCVFPIGLMMIIFIGGELFTGDCLMIMGYMDKKYKIIHIVKVLLIVYISNLIGSLILAFLVNRSGQLNYTNNLLGAYTIKVALNKSSINFTTGIASGILCNIFVCAAVLMATASKNVSGKILAVFFPIFAFVVSGYEHCVANMYYIPAGIFALNNEVYVNKAISEYGITIDQLSNLNWGSFFMKNQLPVTIGNIIGGMFFIGLALYFVHHKKLQKRK